MINWANSPPDDSGLPHLALKRVPARGAIKGVITTTEILGVWTHFLGRRTLPCTTVDCPGCKAKLTKRYEAYVSLWTNSPSAHIIVALTPRAARELTDSAENPKDMRGLMIIIQRLGQRANGMLTARVESADGYTKALPPIPELRAHMLKIWGLDQSQISQDHPMYKAATDQPENWDANEHG